MLPLPPQGKKLHFLFVDDEPHYLIWMEDYLAYHGHEFVISPHPEQAVRLLREKHSEFDAVITDYNMPYMKGNELKEYCSEMWETLPVFLWSSMPEGCPVHPCLEKSNKDLDKIITKLGGRLVNR